MASRHSRRIILLVLGLFLVSSVSVFLRAQASADPVAEFRQADGTIKIPGGRLTPALQARLFSPIPEPTNYTFYEQVRDGHPTIEIRGTVYNIIKGPERMKSDPNGLGKVVVEIGRFLWTGIRGMVETVVDFFTANARATTITAAQTGPWDDTNTWTGGVVPGIGDIANINGKTVTVRTSVPVFQVNANVANSVIIFDPTINAANLTFTFDDTANAGFTCSGGLVGERISSVGTSTYSVTIKSAVSPPTNLWQIQTSVTCWHFTTGYVLNYTSLVDTSANILCLGGPATCTHTNVTWKRTGAIANTGFLNSGTTTTRLINPVFDKVNCCGTVSGPRVLFLDNPTAINGGSLTAGNGAAAAAGIVAYRTFGGTANDYRFVFGNTVGNLSDLDSGDRPASTENVTWGSGLSVEKRTVDYNTTWNSLVFGGNNVTLNVAASTTLTVSTGTVTLASTRAITLLTTGSMTVVNLTIGTGTFTAASGTITVNGNWDSSAGTFTRGTSTVVMNATGNLTTVASSGAATFYNLNITSGTTTLQTNIGVGNVFTVNGGTFQDNAVARTVYIRNDTGGTDPLVYSSGTIQGTTDAAMTLVQFSTAGTLVNMPGGTYTNVNHQFQNVTTVSGDGYEYRLAGNLNSARILFVTLAAAPEFFNSQTYDVTLVALTSSGAANGVNYGIKATSGTWTFSGAVIITSGSNFYIQYGSSSWIINGSASGFAWNLVGVDADASGKWLTPSTATVTFHTVTTLFRYSSGATAEFPNLVLDFTLGTSVTYRQFNVDTRVLKVGQGLTITDTGGGGSTTYTTLNSDGATVTDIVAGGLTVTTAGILTANSATITVSGDWDSSLGTFTRGTSIVGLSGAVKTVKENGTAGFTTLDITGTITALNAINVSTEFKLDGNSATYTTTGADLNIGSTTGVATNGNVLVSVGGTFTMVGSPAFVAPSNWDSSGGTFTKGTSTVTMSGTSKTVAINGAAGFHNLAISGTVQTTTALDVGDTLSVSGGLDTNNLNMTLASVSLSAAGYLLFGSGAHTVSGAWTNASVSASWDEGSGTVTFTSTTGATLVFANPGLSADEFNNIVLTSGAGTAQAFTMSGDLRYGGTLTIQDAAGTTELVTAGFGVSNFSSGFLVVGDGGILTASTSSVFVGNVQMTGGTSGVVTITSGTWQLGSVGAFVWDTSGVGSTFTAGTGTVTIGNASWTATIKILAGQGFNDLVINATDTALSDIEASGTITINAGWTLDTNGFDIRFVTLTVLTAGFLVMDGFTVSSMSMTTSSGTILLTAWTAYDLVTPDVQWVFDPSSAPATVTITAGGLAATTQFGLQRDAVQIQTAMSNGLGSVTFSFAGGWSSHAMKIAMPVGGGGGGGGIGGKIVIVSVGGFTYSFDVVPPTGAIVVRIEWDFGDGTTETTVGLTTHTYSVPGTYVVTAKATYGGSSTPEALTKTLEIIVLPGPDALHSAISVVFVLVLLIAAFSRGRKKLAAAVSVLGIEGTMLFGYFGFTATNFSFFMPPDVFRGVVVFAGLVALGYGLWPSKKERKHRAFWTFFGTLSILLWVLNSLGV